MNRQSFEQVFAKPRPAGGFVHEHPLDLGGSVGVTDQRRAAKDRIASSCDEKGNAVLL